MIEFDQDPYRLSGTVYGVLMNDPDSLLALGEAVKRAPYKAPPQAPVLYIKPRNTLASQRIDVRLGQDQDELEINATIGLVFGHPACRVEKAEALSVVSGITLVADLTIPHDNFYRPSVRYKAIDGSCVFGKKMTPIQSTEDIEGMDLSIEVNGKMVRTYRLNDMVRSADQLVADVTEFMTLSRGDVLLVGLKANPVIVNKGDQVRIASSLGELAGVIE